MSERPCPTCAQPLTGAQMGPVRLDVCLPCSSVWFDRDDLPTVIAAGYRVLWRLCEKLRSIQGTNSRTAGPGVCPTCRLLLGPVEYTSMPGVRLLDCEQCHGHWVDVNTLWRIATKLAEAAQGPAAPAKPTRPTDRIPTPGTTPPVGAPPIHPAFQPSVAPVPPALRTPTAAATPNGQPPVNGVHHPSNEPAGAPPARGVAAAAGGIPCPHCEKPNARDAAVCWACSKPIIPPVAGKCPRCEATTRWVESDGVRIKACEGCGGVQIDDGRLGALLMQEWELQQSVLRQIRSVRNGKIKKLHHTFQCTKCGLIMFGAPIGNMTSRPVNTCPECRSVFMDDGILEEMMTSGAGRPW